MRFRCTHTFRGISLSDYEKLYFDEDFNIALCQSVSLAREVVKLVDEDGHLSRHLKVGPDRTVPAPVAKVLGADRIVYTEEVEYDWGSNRGQWVTISSLLPDKVDARGSFSFREVPGGVERVVEGDISVKLFGVGKVVEKFVVADVERSYVDAARFTQQWIDKA